MSKKKEVEMTTRKPGRLAMAEPDENEQKKDNSGKEAEKATDKFVGSAINTVFVTAKNILLTVCSLIKGLYDFIKRKIEEGKQAKAEKNGTVGENGKPEKDKSKQKGGQKESKQQNDSQQEKNPEMKAVGRAIGKMVKEVGAVIGKLLSSFFNMCKKVLGFAGKKVSKAMSEKKPSTKKPSKKSAKIHPQVEKSSGPTRKEKLQEFADSLPKARKRPAPKWQESGSKSAEKSQPSKKSKYDLSDTRVMVDKALGRSSKP